MQPYHQAFDTAFYVGDVLDVLADLPERSVQAICTSPPYWGLRDYGIPPSVWGGDLKCAHSWGHVLPTTANRRGNKPGDLSTSSLTNPERQDTVKRAENAGHVCGICGAWRGCLGLEPIPFCWAFTTGQNCGRCYLCHLRTVAAALWRVLRDDGVFFLNVGDSYAANRGYQVTDNKHIDVGNTGGMTVPKGLKSKDRVGIPERVALAFQADGWTWRDTIHLCKVAPMPESVTDRTTQAHEPLFVFTKRARYYWDAEGIKEDCGGNTHSRGPIYHDLPKTQQSGSGIRMNQSWEEATWGPVTKRNPRSWMLWPESPMMRLRDNLTDDQRAFVFARLAKYSRKGLA